MRMTPRCNLARHGHACRGQTKLIVFTEMISASTHRREFAELLVKLCARVAWWLALLSAVIVEPKLASAQMDELSEPVGFSAQGHVVVPVNQILTPAGRQVELPGMRPQALGLSPDGKLLAVSGKTHELVLVDPVTGNVLQRVSLPSEKGTNGEPGAVSTHILDPDKEGQLSFTGLIFSADGSRIFLSNVNGSIKVFSVDEAHQVAALETLRLPATGISGRAKEIPSGLALSANGQRLYVVGNMSNRLLEYEFASVKVTRTFDVGVAPYDVVRRDVRAVSRPRHDHRAARLALGQRADER